MAYQVSARKYRPGTFREVVGQPFVVQTLRQALLQKRLAHAYLFFGPRGVGKTTCARILAKAANCENLTPEGDPCLTCPSCQRFQEGRALNLLELDAASHNSVEDIRAIIDQVHLAPPQGRYMVYIIDEVHMLSTAAFNAFLKTLEEPPPHAIFILATTEKHKVPATILSRCQRFDFRRLSTETIVNHLEEIAAREQIRAERDALFLIAAKSEGGLRDALSLFDQLVSRLSELTYEGVLQALEVLDYESFFQLSAALRELNAEEALMLFRRHIASGYDSAMLLQGLMEHFRYLLLAQEAPEALSESIPPHYQKQYREAAGTYSRAFLLHGLDILLEAERRLSFTRVPEIAVEVALSKIALLYQALQSASQPGPSTPVSSSPIPSQKVQPPSPKASESPSSLLDLPQNLQELKKKVLETKAPEPPSSEAWKKALQEYARLQDASSLLKAAIQKDACAFQGPTCTLYLPTEAHVKLLQKQATDLQKFLEKKLRYPNIELILRAAPEKYPELKALQSATERWERLVALNPALESFRQLLKGQIVPQDISHEPIAQQEQEGHTSR